MDQFNEMFRLERGRLCTGYSELNLGGNQDLDPDPRIILLPL